MSFISPNFQRDEFALAKIKSSSHCRTCISHIALGLQVICIYREGDASLGHNKAHEPNPVKRRWASESIMGQILIGPFLYDLIYQQEKLAHSHTFKPTKFQPKVVRLVGGFGRLGDKF
jgi:hypothetical protein